MIYKITIPGLISFESNFRCSIDAICYAFTYLEESPFLRVIVSKRINKGFYKGFFKHVCTLTENDLDKVPR